MMKFLPLNLYLLARLTLTLIPVYIIIGYFKKSIFRIAEFEFPFAFFHESKSHEEKGLFLCGNNNVLLKIRSSLLFVLNYHMKVTRKFNLSLVSRFYKTSKLFFSSF